MPRSRPDTSRRRSRTGLVAGIALVLALGAAPVAIVAPTPGAAAEVSSGLEALRAQLGRLLGSGTGEWAIMATSLDRGDTLFAFDADRPLAPASNQKLFTSAAALHHLGPDFRFPTFLLSDGVVDGGVLEGDLILYGTGDPALSDRLLASGTGPFREFARELKARGVHTVRGDVVGDGTFFQGPDRHASWNARDLNEWFAAPVSALSFNENMVTLQVSPSRPGEPPRIRTQPHAAALHLVNEGMTVQGRPGRTLMLVRDDPGEAIELRGEMTPGQADVWRRLTVSQPAAFTASILLRVLEEEGIRIEGTSRQVEPDEPSRVTGERLVAPAFGTRERPRTWTVSVHRGPPLAELLEVVNKESHNLYAELLLFALGRVAEGEGSFEGGSRAVEGYLERVVGVPRDGLRVEDGSGLSRLNRAPASAFVRVLAHMEAHEHRQVFRASLPEAGNNRELRRMFRSAAAGNLRAKTGTINRVSALSGTVRSAGGELILFSILANDVPSSWAAKQLEDRIGIQLAAFSRPTEAEELPVTASASGEPGAEVTVEAADDGTGSPAGDG